MVDKHDKHHKHNKHNKHNKNHTHDKSHEEHGFGKIHANTEQQHAKGAGARTDIGESYKSPAYPGSEEHGPKMHGPNSTHSNASTKDRTAINSSIHGHEHPGTHNQMNKVPQTHLNSVKNKRDSGWRQAEHAGKKERGRG